MKCPDCKGSGDYSGFNNVAEVCRRCGGKRSIGEDTAEVLESPLFYDPPRYRMCVDVGRLPDKGVKRVPHGIQGVFDIKAIISRAHSGDTFLDPQMFETARIAVNSTNVIAETDADWSNYECLVEIIYTKKEDQ